MARCRIALVSTGGTIEKTYDAMRGILANQVSVLDILLESLELRGVEIARVQLMNKDSLDMTARDHHIIAETALQLAQVNDAVVIVHGTDRLAETGETINRLAPTLNNPIILTGAMRPYELRNPDAVQNVTEALLAAQVLGPGVFCVMHNSVLEFPGVRKDAELGTFVQSDD